MKKKKKKTWNTSNFIYLFKLVEITCKTNDVEIISV